MLPASASCPPPLRSSVAAPVARTMLPSCGGSRATNSATGALRHCQRGRFLIIVKTYPSPSAKYGETVCCAGIDAETGGWIRMFPVNFWGSVASPSGVRAGTAAEDGSHREGDHETAGREIGDASPYRRPPG